VCLKKISKNIENTLAFVLKNWIMRFRDVAKAIRLRVEVGKSA